MSLDLSLHIATTGLRAAQRGLDVVSRNVTNSDTPGYTKKTLDQNAALFGNHVFGVQTGELRRIVDSRLQREVFRQEGNVAHYNTMKSYLGQIESLHGKPDSEESLGNRINALRDRFAKLMDTPESAPMQHQVINVADQLARSLNELSTGVSSTRQQVQKDIEHSLEEVNRNLSIIDTLNREIRGHIYLEKTAPDLEDKRDEALRKVAEYLDVQFLRKGDGTVDVLFTNGQPLLEAGYEKLSTQSFNTTPQAAYPGVIPAIRLGDPATGTDVTGFIRGGRLGALIELRDTALPRYQAQFDEVAQKLSLQMDNAGLRLFTDSAGNVPPSAPVTGYVGYASQIRINPAVQADPTLLRDGTGGGSGTTANSELLRTIVDSVLGANQTFATAGLGPLGNLNIQLPTTATFASFATEIVSHQGNQRADVQARLEAATSLRDQLKTRLSDESGVNLDVEMSNMIQLQRSYSSSAKLITTNRQLFDELLSIVR